MTRWLLILLVGCASGANDENESSAGAGDIPESPSRLEAMLDAVGRDAWRDKVQRIEFTWHHLGKQLQRSYEWDLWADLVTATVGDRTETFPGDGPGELHGAFINDSYWFLFELLIAEDGSRTSTLGPVQPPGFKGKLPEMSTIDVRYPGGDRYVLFVDPGNMPRAWSFHKDTARKPTLVTTREKHVRFLGVTLPTEFRTADGTLVIRIENIRVNGEAIR